jgi:general secretion pathway protein A
LERANVSSSNPISPELYYRNKSLLRCPVAHELFFGLHENPFSLTPDPRYLFRTRHAHETLRQLARGILARQGLIVLSGEVGTGKTTLLNTALQIVGDTRDREGKTRAVVLAHPTLTREEFIEAVFTDFGLPCEPARTPRRLQLLQEMLIKLRHHGATAILAIDEAQLLSPDLLEEIAALLTLRHGNEALLQIVLCGQPEIEGKFDRSRVCNLQRMVAVRCTTAPLSFVDTRDYIHHRMRVAGAKSESMFSAEAAYAVHLHSRGIPRLINLLCGYALANAALHGVSRINARVVDEAVARMPFPYGRPPGPRPRRPSNGSGPTSRSGPGAPPPVGPGNSGNHPFARALLAVATRRLQALPGQQSQSVAAKNASGRLGADRRFSLRAWSQWLDRWWSVNVAQAKYSLILVDIALLGTVLLAVAQVPIPAAIAWQRTARSAVGFTGLLLLDISLGLVGYLFIDDRRRHPNSPSATNLIWSGYKRLQTLLRGTASSQ